MSEHPQADIVLSTAGEKVLRAVLEADPKAVGLVIAHVNGRITGFLGKECFTLEPNGAELLVESLKKALDAVSASIALAEDEIPNPEDLEKLWAIESATDREPKPLSAAARWRRFCRQFIRAWNKRDALTEAAKRGAQLILGVRTTSAGMEVIFEEGVLFGSAEANVYSVSNRMWVRDALQKALDFAEARPHQ